MYLLPQFTGPWDQVFPQRFSDLLVHAGARPDCLGAHLPSYTLRKLPHAAEVVSAAPPTVRFQGHKLAGHAGCVLALALAALFAIDVVTEKKKIQTKEENEAGFFCQKDPHHNTFLKMDPP